MRVWLDELLEEHRALARETASLEKRVWTTRMRAQAARDWAAAVRAASPRDRRSEAQWRGGPVTWFTIDGELAGRHVRARWSHGRLDCDERLLTQAQLLVDLGTVFVNHDPPASVDATLTGAPPAVMLTLARACDRVDGVDFSPAPGH
jgi:hypothetical protein